MGRKAYKNTNLPPRMRARAKAKGVIYYYYDLGGKPRKEKPLGSNYIVALQEWAKLEQVKPVHNPTFNDAAQMYQIDVIPTKAARTQQDNLKELPMLLEFFDGAPLGEIKPINIRQFLTWRCKKARDWLAENGRKVDANSGQVRANREKALFSHIFNYARDTGLTDAPNPCQGVTSYSEDGRDVYVSDSLFAAVWEASPPPLQDALDLAYLTGQRPSDTVALSDHDIRDGYLHVKQGKTGAKLRIEVTGKLKAVIERIRSRRNKFKVVTTYLVVSQYGRPVQRRTVSEWLKQVREATGIPADDFQFRDLRAKAGTDKEDTQGMAAAKDQLGHANESMTAHYVRHRLGKKVSPTR